MLPLAAVEWSQMLSLMVCPSVAIIAVAAAATAVSVGVGAYSSSQQAKASKEAAGMQQDASLAAIDLQREQYQAARQDIAPWRQAGIRGLAQYERLARQGPPTLGTFTAPKALDPRQFAFTEQFQAPTEADLRQDPSYQFRLGEGQRALERSAAARGGLLSGGFARGLTHYAQGAASQEYGNVYGRRQGEYQQRLGLNQLCYGRAITQNEQQYERAREQYQTRYNAGMGTWQARLEPWQRLAYGGQTSATQLGQLGGQYASQVGSILQANANAQGASQLAQANAWSTFAGQTSNALGGLAGLYAGGMGNNPASVTTPQSGYNPNTAGYNPWAY